MSETGRASEQGGRRAAVERGYLLFVKALQEIGIQARDDGGKGRRNRPRTRKSGLLIGREKEVMSGGGGVSAPPRRDEISWDSWG